MEYPPGTAQTACWYLFQSYAESVTWRMFDAYQEAIPTGLPSWSILLVLLKQPAGTCFRARLKVLPGGCLMRTRRQYLQVYPHGVSCSNSLLVPVSELG